MKKPPPLPASVTESPRVDAVIAEVMAKHPRETPRALAVYYEAVHQELAPMARQLEQEIDQLRRHQDDWKRLTLAVEARAAKLEILLRAADNKLEAIGKYHGGAQATAIDKLREKIRAGLEGPTP